MNIEWKKNYQGLRSDCGKYSITRCLGSYWLCFKSIERQYSDINDAKMAANVLKAVWG